MRWRLPPPEDHLGRAEVYATRAVVVGAVAIVCSIVSLVALAMSH